MGEAFSRAQTLTSGDIRRASQVRTRKSLDEHSLRDDLAQFQGGKKKRGAALHLTKEDYKIFYRDLKFMYKHFTIQDHLISHQNTTFFSDDEGGDVEGSEALDEPDEDQRTQD